MARLRRCSSSVLSSSSFYCSCLLLLLPFITILCIGTSGVNPALAIRPIPINFSPHLYYLVSPSFLHSSPPPPLPFLTTYILQPHPFTAFSFSLLAFPALVPPPTPLSFSFTLLHTFPPPLSVHLPFSSFYYFSSLTPSFSFLFFSYIHFPTSTSHLFFFFFLFLLLLLYFSTFSPHTFPFPISLLFSLPLLPSFLFLLLLLPVLLLFIKSYISLPHPLFLFSSCF